MDMSFLYTKAATHDKKVLNKVLTVNVWKAVTDLAAVVSRLEEVKTREKIKL
jgi:hypothetical protein